MLTWSKELKAEFDPGDSELTVLDQRNDFRYEQGDRKGRAERASLDAKQDLITLVGGARIWDPKRNSIGGPNSDGPGQRGCHGRRTRRFHARARAREEADGGALGERTLPCHGDSYVHAWREAAHTL